MKSIVSFLDKSSINFLQLIKLAVYALLLINFALYIRDDWVIASHTMRNGGTFLDWTGAFATSIDESAWFILLLLFELETYVLSDEAITRGRMLLIHSLRIICYFSLAHTVYAFSDYVYELSGLTPIADIGNLCQFAGDEISFATNLIYTEINADNCSSLSPASQFFYIDPPENFIVTDSSGLVIELQLAWVDLLEVVVWLLILFTIEMSVYLQDNGISAGALIRSMNIAKSLLYSLLWLAMAYWVYRGHWMFAWDEFVWIAGFIAIEMNVVEWRNETIDSDQVQGSA